ncbi:MAG: class I SAM-dependent methyltransferase [bacterium]
MNHADKKVTGWDFYFFRSRMAFRYRISGITPERALELPWCFNRLILPPDGVLLDIGSRNSEFPLFVAWKTRSRVIAVDVDPIILKQKEAAGKLARTIPLDVNKISFQQQDAVKMDFPDNYFDVVTAISVLEHITGDGDAQTLSEIHRILKPGGHFYLTVPCAQKYTEEFVNRNVYGRKFSGEPLFFSRIYDDETLQGKLLNRTPLQVVEKTIFGQPHFDFYSVWWKKLPASFRLLFCWMSPWIAAIFYREMGAASESHGQSIACLILKKDLLQDKQGGLK